MSKRVQLALAAIVSDDGTRCAAECPHYGLVYDGLDADASVIGFSCERFDAMTMAELGDPRFPACIAAEVSTVEGES